MGIFVPSDRALRKPTDPSLQNGKFLNPPTFAELGGLTSAKKIAHRNNVPLQKGTGSAGGGDSGSGGKNDL